MLKQLHISNYALIDELDVSFEQGFNVITGETGAGKSILLGALGFALGDRADTGVLYDKDDDSSVIPLIDKALFEKLKGEGRIVAGMLPKLKNAFEAIDSGVGSVVIKNSAKLLEESGTTIR